MIHEVDDSLRAMIDADVTNGGVDVSFDAPTRDWAARRSGPTINVFLYDIREDLDRRDLAPQIVRNDDGRIVARRPPPRRFKLSYLLTAWTQRPEDEHRLLSMLLLQFLQYDAIPDEHLRGSLVDVDIPVVIDLALPAGPDRSLSDIWSALGGELKPSLDLIIVAPFDPNRGFEVGPPVIEEPILGLDRLDGEGVRPRRTLSPLDEGEGEVIVAGADRPGRTVHLHRVARPGSKPGSGQ